MKLPGTLPHRDKPGMWQMQQTLLRMAERLLGKMERGKTVYQPVFSSAGPLLRNTPALDGAFAELSMAARTWWPTAVYEMAHETVHLLNPVARNGNRLEEGIAVAFSIYAQHRLRLPNIQQPHRGAYYNAWQWAEEMPGGAFAAARQLRKAHGALGSITAGQMRECLPDMPPDLARKLGRAFYRTPSQKQTLGFVK